MNEESPFQEALSRPAAESAAFLDAACAGQPQLRAAVGAFLVALERSEKLLDKLPVTRNRRFRSRARRKIWKIFRVVS
jgi:hypothetical protein